MRVLGAQRSGDAIQVRYAITEEALRRPGRPWHLLVSADDPFDEYTPMTIRAPVSDGGTVELPAGLGKPTQVLVRLEAANGRRGEEAYGVIE